MTAPTLPEVLIETVEAVKRLGSQDAAAEYLGTSQSVVSKRLAQAAALGEKFALEGYAGTEEKFATLKRDLPAKGKIKRYLLTGIQSNTRLHKPTWQNLTTLAEHYGAEIICRHIPYRKAGYMARAGMSYSEEDVGEWYANEAKPFRCHDRVQLAPGLVFCGEVWISPTARYPLARFEQYTGRASTILAHPQRSMRSVVSSKSEATKFMYTTGVATLRNYIPRREGFHAESVHTYGALLVEVTSDGSWFVRQVETGPDGAMYDCDIKVYRGKVHKNQRVEDVTLGDVHALRMDKEIAKVSWGKGGMLDVLQPKQVHIHDLLDFNSRSHHTRGKPMDMYRNYIDGTERVADEFEVTKNVVLDIRRKGRQLKVVDSNHDRALERWLDEANYRRDPVNALTFLKLELARYEAASRKDENFHVAEYALRQAGVPEDVIFLREDCKDIICPDIDGGIDCSHHGHNGPNGSRGVPAAFTKMGRRANTAHTHSAGIHDHVYTAGTSSLLDQRWNRGPSSWSHTHIVTYPNSTRALFTLWKGKWRA